MDEHNNFKMTEHTGYSRANKMAHRNETDRGDMQL
jgi:hypothetical protein